jgi:hypothetical protein
MSIFNELVDIQSVDGPACMKASNASRKPSSPALLLSDSVAAETSTGVLVAT